jgi:hypothetical protein
VLLQQAHIYHCARLQGLDQQAVRGVILSATLRNLASLVRSRVLTPMLE